MCSRRNFRQRDKQVQPRGLFLGPPKAMVKNVRESNVWKVSEMRGDLRLLLQQHRMPASSLHKNGPHRLLFRELVTS